MSKGRTKRFNSRFLLKNQNKALKHSNLTSRAHFVLENMGVSRGAESKTKKRSQNSWRIVNKRVGISGCCLFGLLLGGFFGAHTHAQSFREELACDTYHYFIAYPVPYLTSSSGKREEEPRSHFFFHWKHLELAAPYCLHAQAHLKLRWKFF